MTDDKFRNEEPEVEGHKKPAGVEGRVVLEPEDKVGPGRRGLDEEPEVEGHLLKSANPEKRYKKG